MPDKVLYVACGLVNMPENKQSACQYVQIDRVASAVVFIGLCVGAGKSVGYAALTKSTEFNCSVIATVQRSCWIC